MSQFEFDWETYVFFPVFGLGAAATLGLVSTDILPWFNLADVVVEFGNIEWTIGRLLSLAALVAVTVNRDEPFDFGKWGVVELWTLYATLGLIIAPPFFPALEQTLAETPAAFISFTVQSIGFAQISYLN